MIEIPQSLKGQVKESAWRHMEGVVKGQREERKKKADSAKKDLESLVKEEVHFGYKYLAVRGGYGPGKKAICSMCGEHDSIMHHMSDGQWYCQEHKHYVKADKREKEDALKKLRSRHVNQQN